ncbi:MAG: hypothetical protein H6608_02920 [Flavobacteriales bacterium]|nr:hypothetical protein [Bacteroidota bacterium]MCB9240060.1 hypothetical protein [Flavobacteriales bacterium]
MTYLHSKAFKHLLLFLAGAGILLAIFHFMILYYDWTTFDYQGPRPMRVKLIYAIDQFLKLTSLWVGIWFFFKDEFGFKPLIPLGIATMTSALQFLPDGLKPGVVGYEDMILLFATFLVFGWNTKTNGGWVWIAVVPVILVGLSYTLYHTFYEELFGELFMNAFDPFAMELPHDDGGYRRIDFLLVLYSGCYPLLSGGLLFLVLDKLSLDNNHTRNLLNPWIWNQPDKLVWSLLFWPLRFTLFVVIFGSLLTPNSSGLLMFYSERSGGLLIVVFTILAILGASLVLRNLIVSYQNGYGKKPRLVYLLLHLPLLHFTAWLISLFYQRKPEQDNEITLTDETHQRQRIFSLSNKNLWFKFILVFGMILSIVATFMGDQGNSDSLGSYIEPILLGLTLILVLTYINYPVMMWYLLGLECCVVFATLLFKAEMPENPYMLLGIGNVVMMYSLFHFDQFSFTTANENGSTVSSEVPQSRPE